MERSKDTFKDGDLVCLKSGGPIMTIDHKIISDNKSFVCCWFDNDMKYSSAIFSVSAITSVSESMRNGHYWTVPDIAK
jgi:uncharacterized protein YodC (DUF2158 family)